MLKRIIFQACFGGAHPLVARVTRQMMFCNISRKLHICENERRGKCDTNKTRGLHWSEDSLNLVIVLIV